MVVEKSFTSIIHFYSDYTTDFVTIKRSPPTSVQKICMKTSLNDQTSKACQSTHLNFQIDPNVI